MHAAQPTIQTLLSTSDFCGALDLIAATQEILEQELAGIHCFRHLAAQLAEMATFVDKMVQAEFGQAVAAHLAIDGDPVDDEEQLVPCLLGMLRIGKVRPSLLRNKFVCSALLRQSTAENSSYEFNTTQHRHPPFLLSISLYPNY